jgi:hypothetical protein
VVLADWWQRIFSRPLVSGGRDLVVLSVAVDETHQTRISKYFSREKFTWLQLNKGGMNLNKKSTYKMLISSVTYF